MKTKYREGMTQAQEYLPYVWPMKILDPDNLASGSLEGSDDFACACVESVSWFSLTEHGIPVTCR